MARVRTLMSSSPSSELWLGACLVALAVPLLVHDLAWLMRHWDSLWILDAVLSVFRHA